MKSITRKDRVLQGAVVAAATLSLLSAASVMAQGRPAAAGNNRAVPSMPSMPARVPSRVPVTIPEKPAAPAAAENAASATTTVEHTEDGIVRTTTVTNRQGTMSGSTVVSKDADGQAVTTTQTGFDGETRSVENTVTHTEEGAEHELTKSTEEDDAESDETAPPES